MFKRILLTLDGSAQAEQAIPTALSLSKNFQASLTLLTVVRPLAITYRAGAALLDAVEEAKTELIEEASTYLKETSSQIRESGHNVTVATRFGSPSQSIIEFVRENEIDLVVMCTRGQSGAARWLLGGVVEHIVRGSPVPVMVIPAQTSTASR